MFKYLNFKVDIKSKNCWKFEEDGKETLIEKKFTDKYGSLGFVLFEFEDWKKSGRNAFLNCRVRKGMNFSLSLEVFYKHYNPTNEEFAYYKKYFPMGGDYFSNSEKTGIMVSFTEEDRVEKDRNTAKWVKIKK